MARRKHQYPSAETPAPQRGRRGRRPKAAEPVQPVVPAKDLDQAPETSPAASEQPTELFDPSATVPQRRRGRRAKGAAPAGTPSEPAAASTPETPEAATAAGQCEPALAKAEAELIARYPARRIKPGSLKPAGAVPGLGLKRTVLIECANCGAERRVPTSDLFHVSLCKACKKQSSRKGKAAEAEELPTEEGGNP